MKTETFFSVARAMLLNQRTETAPEMCPWSYPTYYIQIPKIMKCPSVQILSLAQQLRSVKPIQTLVHLHLEKSTEEPKNY